MQDTLTDRVRRQRKGVGPDEVRAFVAGNHRAVLITRRPLGALQTSPVLVGVDGEGS
jgi:hypothetical protein